ncbi:MAG: Wzz/FepE/Etk N-terminal domain-containing protein, partial [Chloroflexota bacterium]
MDIQYYVSLFWRRKFIILATTLATLVPAVMYAQSLEPIYRSYATLRFSTSLTGDQTWVSYDIDYTERIVNTYTALATTGPVLDVVRQRVGTEDLPTITVAGITSTELIAITVEGSDPELNTDVANALGDILTERDIDMFRDDTGSSQQILEDLRAGTTAEIQLLQVNLSGLEEGSNAAIATQARINLLEQRFQALDDQVTALAFVQSTRDQQVNFIERAIVPHSPEGPNGNLFIILGGLAGFAGGIALSLLFHMNDDRMYTHEDIKSSVTSPIVGRLPKYKVHNVLDMFAAERGKFEREMLRRVATQVKLVLRDLDNVQGKPILMVTSASTGEGKTSFVSGLSLALKDLGMNPLVVDGDLRRPTIHTLFEVPNQMGLSDYIARDVNDLNVLINKSAVDVLPAGEQGEMSNHLGMVAQQLFKTLRFDT